jgi:hypothetical protein
VRDRVFRDDFMVLATGGLPLWDGVTDIEVRLARPDEEVKWRASRAKAIRQCKIQNRADPFGQPSQERIGSRRGLARCGSAQAERSPRFSARCFRRCDYRSRSR